MKSKKNTRRALLTSMLSLLICVSMLVGSTFAWFTDSVTSKNNIIKSGNLDVELYYQVEGQSDWTKVTNTTSIFKENALWEPGHTEVVKLKVVNEGTLALKYKLGVNVASETESTSKDGGVLKLSDHIKYGIVKGAQSYTREQAVAAVAAAANALNVSYTSDITELPAKNDGDTDEKIITLVVYMPTTVGNEANYAKGAKVPTINLGINLYATQVEAESDSFDEKYDQDAEFPWDGNSIKQPAVVDGSYAIGTPAELAWLAARSAATQKAHLTADIDMMGATISSIELTSYHTFEGNGKKISNVTVEGTGLFGNCSADGNIRNLILDNVTVNTASGDYAGIVGGKYSGTYTNVTVLNSTVYAPNSEYVGGFAGAVYKNMTGCKAENISVTGTEKVGGLVGFFTLADVGYSIKLKDCSVKNATVTATNTAKPYAGVFFGRGLATGAANFVFENCSASMKSGQVLVGQDYYNNIDDSAIAVTNIP